MFSLYGFECYISGISVARQMILHLKRKNFHFIFTKKSDRAIVRVRSELEPYKRYFTYIAPVLIQIHLLGKISCRTVSCQDRIPMRYLITFSLLMLHYRTSRRIICPLITMRFKLIVLNLMWIISLCYYRLQIFFLTLTFSWKWITSLPEVFVPYIKNFNRVINVTKWAFNREITGA
jgi:hypothetical protein